MSTGSGDVTRLLQAWSLGDRQAGELLFETVLPELRRIAGICMHRERKDHTLQPTELIDEIYFRLVAAKDREWRCRGHFFAIAARAMRRYLIDYARSQPKAEIFSLDIGFVPADGKQRSQIELAAAINILLDQLAELEPDWCTIVELKFYLGLTDQEAAEMMGIPVRSLQRQWKDARIWLYERLGSSDAAG